MLEENLMAPHLENSSALLALGVATGVEYHAVARLEIHGERVESHMVAGRVFHEPYKGAAFFSEPRADEFLVIHAVHPAWVEAARESHLQAIPIFG